MTPDALRLLTDAAPPVIAGLALSLGAAAAQASGPIAWKWPAEADELMERVVALKQAPAGKLRRALAAGLIALLLGGGALAAYAAEPSAPEQLPKEVVGVVGSGDQLSLQVKPADGSAPKTLKVGDQYKDGWTVQALTPTEATLSKAGDVRRVGLNPTGALAPATAPAAPPSSVTTVGIPDKATIEYWYQKMLADNPGPHEMPLPGLTVDETKRVNAYVTMVTTEIARRRALDPTYPAMGKPGDVVAIIGQAASDDNNALGKKEMAVRHDEDAADLQAHPITGPSSYYQAPGQSLADADAAASAAGVDNRGGWFALSDGQGGTYYIRVSDGVNPVPPGTNITDYAKSILVKDGFQPPKTP